jgi:YfiH family protein
VIESSLLSASGEIHHGFFTRHGGVSQGIYASLNCGLGSNDDADCVARNRAQCAEALGIAPDCLVTAYQIHGISVAKVTAPWKPGEAPRADAMVTAQRGIALGILTADCGPILLADADAGVIGAAHSGWKGAKAGVAAATVTAMIELGARRERIIAALGPTIGLKSYEVGEEFRQAFLADDPSAARFFAAAQGKRPHFDLGGFIVAQLERLGLAGIDRIEADTCAEADRFFSYRRACLSGEGDYARQLSAIALA